MKQERLINWAGNKEREMKYIVPYVKLRGIKTIVEPFGGSFAFSRYFFNSKKKLKFIINDADPLLIETYKAMKDPKRNKEILDEIRKLEPTFKENKEEYKKLIQKPGIVPFLIKNTYYAFRVGMFPLKNPKRKTRIPYERLKNFSQYASIEFINKDGMELMKEYLNRPDVFLYLDPPYFLSCNDFYMAGLNEDFFKTLKLYYKNKTKFLLSINYHILMETFMEFYKFKIKFSYDIVYRLTKSNGKHNGAKHLIICNY